MGGKCISLYQTSAQTGSTEKLYGDEKLFSIPWLESRGLEAQMYV